jgi:phage shock protein E
MGFFKSLMGATSSKQDLAEKIKQGAKIVDVRTVAEYADGHYPNALNIPLDALQTRIAEFGSKEKCVIVYCASGARSAMAARTLKTLGYTDVINAGGLADLPSA